MSVAQYPERVSVKDVQVWDNAAFDDDDDDGGGGGDFESSNVLKVSWSNNINPMSSFNVSNKSFDSDGAKENVSPSCDALVKLKPLNVDGVGGDDVGPKAVLKDKDLDIEIEEIEKEIRRLSKRLECLKVEKVRMMNAKVVEKRGGRIMASKFMEGTKHGVRISDDERKREDSMNVSGKLKTPRRGVSLGPAEIMRGMRRGVSLGPSEIYSSTKIRNLGRQEITPLQPSANRRKSCYWKLQDIDELRVTKERGKSMSLSPKSRSKSVIKPQGPVKAATTIGVKKTVKKEEGVMSLIEPKKLFVKDGEKSVTKKPLKSGRVVPSRYNQISSGGSSALKELRKRSWPDNGDEIKRSEKKRVSLVTKSGSEKPVAEGRVKKLWDIPNEASVQRNVDHKTPLSVTKILEVVPRIKTYRSAVESPRDSGPAKRVAELVEKKSVFSMDDVGENPDDEYVCQVLNFEEEQVIKEYPKIRVLRSINESPRNSGAAKRVSQLVGRKPFFAADDDEDIPVFSFEEDEEK